MRSRKGRSSSPRPARSRTGSPASDPGKIVNDGETVTLSVYLATATGSVHGVVRRPDGSPAANAAVVISNADGAIGFNVTVADGSYTQDLIPLGPFTIDAFEASNAGHGAATGQIFIAGQDIPVDITEDALAVVTGHVVEAGSLAPLKGWRVSFSQQTHSGRSISLTTTSGVDGGFSFPGAAVGAFNLMALNPDVQGSAQAQGDITQAGQAVDLPLVVTVTRPSFGRIEGVVSYANGAPAANANACISSCELGSLIVTAASDGTFAFDHQPLGRSLVLATPQTGVESGSAIASIDFDGGVAQVRIVLAGISQISGTVLSNGSPARGASVSFVGHPHGPARGLRRRQWPFLLPRRVREVVHDHRGGRAASHHEGRCQRPAQSWRVEGRAGRARADRKLERARAPRQHRQGRCRRHRRRRDRRQALLHRIDRRRHVCVPDAAARRVCAGLAGPDRHRSRERLRHALRRRHSRRRHARCGGAGRRGRRPGPVGDGSARRALRSASSCPSR